MTKTLAPVVTRKSLSNTYHYAGGTISILLSGRDTGGEFAAWEAVQKPGSEPPLHVHHSNDETFFVTDGEMRFMVGDKILNASAGSVVFAPRGVPHTFKIMSAQASAITCSTPAGFEEWFQELGEPATSFELPEHAKPLTEAKQRKMMALGQRLRTETVHEIEL